MEFKRFTNTEVEMLVLTRRIDESIVIGMEDGVTITVVSIKGDRVRLGIEAPTRIAVHREEVYNKIVKENARARTTPVTTNTALKTA